MVSISRTAWSAIGQLCRARHHSLAFTLIHYLQAHKRNTSLTKEDKINWWRTWNFVPERRRCDRWHRCCCRVSNRLWWCNVLRCGLCTSIDTVTQYTSATSLQLNSIIVTGYSQNKLKLCFVPFHSKFDGSLLTAERLTGTRLPHSWNTACYWLSDCRQHELVRRTEAKLIPLHDYSILVYWFMVTCYAVRQLTWQHYSHSKRSS